MINFELIEDKMVGKLKKELSYLKTVETYAGQLEEEIERLPVRFPAAFVVYGGSSFEWIDGPSHRETVEFSVLLCAKDLRGGEEARQGAYALVEAAKRALVNETFGLDIERLRPAKVSLVFVSKTAAIYGVDFQTGFDNEYQW